MNRSKNRNVQGLWALLYSMIGQMKNSTRLNNTKNKEKCVSPERAPYLPHRHYRLPVSLCPDRFLMDRSLELHYPVNRSGLEDRAEL